MVEYGSIVQQDVCVCVCVRGGGIEKIPLPLTFSFSFSFAHGLGISFANHSISYVLLEVYLIIEYNYYI